MQLVQGTYLEPLLFVTPSTWLTFGEPEGDANTCTYVQPHKSFVHVHATDCVCVPFGFTEGEPSTCVPFSQIVPHKSSICFPFGCTYVHEKGTRFVRKDEIFPEGMRVRATPKVREEVEFASPIRARARAPVTEGARCYKSIVPFGERLHSPSTFGDRCHVRSCARGTGHRRC